MTPRVSMSVAGFLALSLLVGVFLTFGASIQLAVAALFVAVAPVALARHVTTPGLGVRLLLITALLLPVEFFVGATALSLSFLYAAFLLVTWLLREMIVERSVMLDSSRVVVATLFFMAAAILSFLVGQYPWFPIDGAPLRAQLGGLGLFVLSGGTLLVVAHETRALSQLKVLTWLFIGVGAIALATMFVPATEITVGGVRVLSRGSVGSLFFTWLVAMSVSQAFWNRSLSRAMRALLLVIAAVALGRGLFVTFDWASGWIPPLIALGILLLFRFPRLAVSGGLLLAAPAAVASGAAWNSLMAGESWSWLTRIEAQRVLQQVIAREPIFGLGPANYHFYTYLFPILGYRSRFNSHNNYTDFLAQGGIVGLFVFCWLAFEALRLAHRLYLRAPDGFSRAYALGTFSGVASSLAAGMLADWIVPFVYNIGILGFRSSVLFWFFVGGLVAMKRLTVGADMRDGLRRPDLAWEGS